MVQKIVDDIRAALNNDLYFVALSAALTLPDICGKAEYPGEKSSKKRYIDWYDKEIGYYEKNPHQTTDEEMPYLSGSVIYSLRCSLLHEGNPNVDNDRLTKRNESLPIDHYVLKIERKNDFDIYSDGSGISDMFGQHSRSYRMSIRRVCLIICCVAEAYYKENKEKFHFNYEILDWDKATEGTFAANRYGSVYEGACRSQFRRMTTLERMEEKMSLENIRGVIRKIDYTLTEDEIDDWCEACRYAIQTETYDFSSFSREVYSQSGKKRVIYSFPKLSVENMLSHYLKKQLDRAFHIKYASRSKIINLLFNTLVATKNMNDFVIVRADFKSFFDSVKSEYVYEKYILPSIIKRGDKQLLEKYVENFKYCYAGLCLSNGMTEIVCKDFDIVLKARLSEYGVFFYERYVDDMLIMFNNYISEDRIKNIIGETIIEVFGSCPVRLSSGPGKFSYISRRNLVLSQSFNFLGYEFFILKTVNGIIEFEYGIAEKKRTKYSNMIERAFINYKLTGNDEVFRQQLKIFSSRVVIARQILGSNFDWLTKGVIANYNELQNVCDYLNVDTKTFLSDLFYQLLRKYDIKRPYFLPKRTSNEESIYNLYSNMKRNRSLLFEESIGVPKEVVLEWIHKIDPFYSSYGKDYYRIVVEYLEMIKIN